MVRDVVKMKDIQFEKGLFENWMTGKIMDELLCSYKGLPKGVNYMVIGDQGVGMKSVKTRNFEAGILTDEPSLLDAAIEHFDSVWAGFRCKDCSRKKFCGDPIIP